MDKTIEEVCNIMLEMESRPSVPAEHKNKKERKNDNDQDKK